MRPLIVAILMVVITPELGITQSPSSSQGQLQTPEQAGMANVPSAASAPLHDLNLGRRDIPPLLLEAMTDPYRPPASLACRALIPQVQALNAVLGADFDQRDTPLQAPLSKRGSKVGLALLHGAAETLLPYAGFVRTLSGAQKHDEQIVEAITAGSVRRGYLKGLADGRGCRPPAAPDHSHRQGPPRVQTSRH